jgi:pSer/pThr/pTyr-binding forkhead associated (FHA) protein
MRIGPTPGKIFPLSKAEIYLGRDITSDIVLNDPEVSRKHTRLLLQPNGGYLVEDLGSTNGTFVNGQRLLGPHLLREGELVMFGENIGLVYEQVAFDPEATVISDADQVLIRKPEPRPTVAPAVQPAYEAVQPSAYVTPQPPVYTGQAPLAPTQLEPQVAPKKGGMRPWLLAGCGCLILAAIGCAGVLYVVDAMDLWCTLFGFILPGCP